MRLETFSMDALEHCMLCPRCCGVNRLAGERGYCGAGRLVRADAPDHPLRRSGDRPRLSRALVLSAHGGFDGGAVGANGTVEKDVNLAISLKLRDMLTDAGFRVVMTRDSDCALNDTGESTIRRRKISDMHARLNLTKLYPGSVLISIHQNKLSGDSRVHGAQIFYSPNEPSAKVLAESIQAEFNSRILPEKPRQVVKTGKNLYLFYHAQNTAVLCECGFLSNPDEEALLATEEYQYKVAYCIYSGLLKWYDGDVETTDKN